MCFYIFTTNIILKGIKSLFVTVYGSNPSGHGLYPNVHPPPNIVPAGGATYLILANMAQKYKSWCQVAEIISLIDWLKVLRYQEWATSS